MAKKLTWQDLRSHPEPEIFSMAESALSFSAGPGKAGKAGKAEFDRLLNEINRANDSLPLSERQQLGDSYHIIGRVYYDGLTNFTGRAKLIQVAYQGAGDPYSDAVYQTVDQAEESTQGGGGLSPGVLLFAPMILLLMLLCLGLFAKAGGL